MTRDEIRQEFETMMEEAGYERQIETGPVDDGDYVFSSTMPSEMVQEWLEEKDESDVKDILHTFNGSSDDLGCWLDDQLGGYWIR